MKLHREGAFTINMTLIFILFINAGMYLIFPHFSVASAVILVASLGLLYIILQFFRNPPRTTIPNIDHIIAPADGKLVVMEEVEEPEYFRGKRLQLSIFMSPFNVHVNRYPIGGTVEYSRYHEGKYLVAWHPKSSTENERTTIVVKDDKGREVLFRQIAGAMAKRIIMYSKNGDKAQQGNEMGFIKFGSRVDVFLPIGSKVNVKLNDTVRGGETVLAEF